MTQTNHGDLSQNQTSGATNLKKRRQKRCNICSDCPGYPGTLHLQCGSDNGKKGYTGRVRLDERKCQFCGRRFRSILSKNKHEAQHGKMMYRCPGDCGYMFLNFKGLYRHHIDNHGSGLTRIVAEHFKISPEHSDLETSFREGHSGDMSSGEYSLDKEGQCNEEVDNFATGRLDLIYRIHQGEVSEALWNETEGP